MDLSTQDLSFLDKILKEMAIDENYKENETENEKKAFKGVRPHLDYEEMER